MRGWIAEWVEYEDGWPPRRVRSRVVDANGYCLGCGVRHVGHRHDRRDCEPLRKLQDEKANG